jgi:hypothetical protein
VATVKVSDQLPSDRADRSACSNPPSSPICASPGTGNRFEIARGTHEPLRSAPPDTRTTQHRRPPFRKNACTAGAT